MGGPVKIDGRVAVQGPGQVREQAERNLKEFSRTTVFCTGRKSPWCCTAGTAQPRSSSAEKTPKGLGRQEPEA